MDLSRIAGIASDMKAAQIQTEVSVRVLKMANDIAKVEGAELLGMMDAELAGMMDAELAGMMDAALTGLGQNLDVVA